MTETVMCFMLHNMWSYVLKVSELDQCCKTHNKRNNLKILYLLHLINSISDLLLLITEAVQQINSVNKRQCISNWLCGNKIQNFNTPSTKTCHWTHFWAYLLQFVSLQPVSLRFITVSSSHLLLERLSS